MKTVETERLVFVRKIESNVTLGYFWNLPHETNRWLFIVFHVISLIAPYLP